MRHGKAFRRLGRGSAHRRALLRNLTDSLIRHERIKTTLAKAKELRRPAEQLITLAKKNTPHADRSIQSFLFDQSLKTKLKDELAKRFADRPGGYTRIMKAGFRKPDSAQVAYIEYVDNSLPKLKLTAEDLAAVEAKLQKLSASKTA